MIPLKNSPLIQSLLAILLVALIGLTDYATGWAVSLTLLYLVPITLALCGAGRGAGISLAVLATAVRFAVWWHAPVAHQVVLWNAGLWCGLFLAFVVLLDHLKAASPRFPIRRTLLGLTGLGVGLAGFLWCVGFVMDRRLAATPIPVGSPSILHVASTPGAPAQPRSGVLDELAARVSATRSSRGILLGSRDLNGRSCVTVPAPGATQPSLDNLADYDGGPGTKLAMLLYLDRQNCHQPADDFAWHQGRLKLFLKNQGAENQAALISTGELSEQAMVFAARISACTAWPADLAATPFSDRSSWLAYCLTALNDSIRAKDLEQAKRWGNELASAAMHLHDLHRWLGFLTENHLAALEFQDECATLFSSMEFPAASYDRQISPGNFPAGVLTLHGTSNFYEVERQAERFFTLPPDRMTELATNRHLTDASLWVPPARREAFLQIREALSPENRKAWDAAARMPFEHTYLVNMLFRASHAGDLGPLAAAVRQFDAQHPQASVPELMDVLMYRGHSFAGFEWADRFQPQLVDAGLALAGSDADVLLAASRWTSQFYHASTTYAATLTLHDALANHRLDCVRATDMTGAIYRNAGRSGFGHVRWTAGSAGHSVAAHIGTENDKSSVVMTDGLNPPAQPEVWPEAYFHGHAWPAGMEGNPTPYAAELYVRGLDNYIWAEGYVIRGPSAGTLLKAPVPYLPHREAPLTQKVFDGPYPY